MRSIVLMAACLACAGHARRVQTLNFQEQVKHDAEQMRENGDMPDWKALATLLLASSPKSAFTLSGPGTQPVNVNRNAGVRISTKPVAQRPGAPLMAEDATKVGVLENQKKMQVGKSESVLCQGGGSLRTWSYQTSLIDRVQVVLSTDGRPMDADIQLWEGPDNTPAKIRAYSEDGSERPFSAVIATPHDGASTVAIRNIGQMEFPLAAYVSANTVETPISDFQETSTIVQGGALRTFEFNTAVESVEIMIKTDGRPLNARVELLQGPNNNKQVIELYAEDGLVRPFFAIVDTLGPGNTVRVVNTAPLEFPMFVSVQPHRVNENVSPTDPVIGGDEPRRT